MNDQPGLSVVVPCLNEEGNVFALAERLFTATAEAGVETEVVFVDDGSTDDTAGAIERCRVAWPGRVVGVSHEENRGIPAAWHSSNGSPSWSWSWCMSASSVTSPMRSRVAPGSWPVRRCSAIASTRCG